MWQRLLPRIGCEPWLQLVDSFPLPVCQFARAYRCRCFGGEAAFGYDVLLRQTFYGFRVPVLVAWPGVIVRFSLVPAHVHETAVVPEWVDGRQGIVVGDRNYGSPLLRETLAPQGLQLQAPYQQARQDPWPRRSALLSRLRYRIDTVFGQLVDRYLIQRVRTRDRWHLGHRLLRKVLSHTLAFLLNQGWDHPPTALEAGHLN